MASLRQATGQRGRPDPARATDHTQQGGAARTQFIAPHQQRADESGLVGQHHHRRIQGHRPGQQSRRFGPAKVNAATRRQPKPDHGGCHVGTNKYNRRADPVAPQGFGVTSHHHPYLSRGCRGEHGFYQGGVPRDKHRYGHG